MAYHYDNRKRIDNYKVPKVYINFLVLGRIPVLGSIHKGMVRNTHRQKVLSVRCEILVTYNTILQILLKLHL